MAKNAKATTTSGVQLRIPPSVADDLRQIGAEALRIYESAMFSSQGQFEQAKIWRAMNLWLGAPAAILAALAGSAILSSHGSAHFLGLSLPS